MKLNRFEIIAQIDYQSSLTASDQILSSVDLGTEMLTEAGVWQEN